MLIRKFRNNFQSLQDVRMFSHMFLLVSILPLMMKFFSIPGLMKVLTPKNKTKNRNSDLTRVQEKIVKFTDFILNRNIWIYSSTCLKRSLILYHFLRKAGIDVNLCFGVLYNGSLNHDAIKKLEGHAWLVCKGDIILERNIEITKTYTVTYCFPLERADYIQENSTTQS